MAKSGQVTDEEYRGVACAIEVGDVLRAPTAVDVAYDGEPERLCHRDFRRFQVTPNQ